MRDGAEVYLICVYNMTCQMISASEKDKVGKRSKKCWAFGDAQRRLNI